MSPRLPAAPRRPQGQLLRTTALVSLLPLLASIQPAAAQLYLDNGTGNGVSATDGTWSGAIWSDYQGNNHQDWPGSGTAVLGNIQGNGTATLTIPGDITVYRIVVNDNGFTLASDAGGVGSLSAGSASGTLTFGRSVAGSADINVGAALNGNITVEKDVGLIYSGTSAAPAAGTNPNTIIINDGAKLETKETAKTNGTLKVSGNADLAGQHTGDVENTDTGNVTLTGSVTVPGTVTGNVSNAGVFTVTKNAKIDGSVTNTGKVNQWFELDGGTITGTLDNSGYTYITAKGGTINGNLQNRQDGTIFLGQDDTNVLDVKGRLTSSGTIERDNTRYPLIIKADTILLGSTHVSGSGVVLEGTEVVANSRTISSYTSLNGGLVRGGLLIEGADTVTVTVTDSGTVKGDQNDITNTRGFTLETNADVYDLDEFQNLGSKATLTVKDDAELAAKTVLNTGGTITNAGKITGIVTNENDTLSGAIGHITSTGEIIGTLNNSGAADLAGAISGTLNNSGTDVDVTGDLGVARVNNTGTLRVNSGATLTSTNTIDNSGTLNLQGVGNNAGGIKGNVANTGTINSGAKIDGDLDNDGTANLAGEITGNLDNSTNDLTLTGNLKVGSLTNRQNATVEVKTGQTLTSTGTVTNEQGGTVRVLGALSGDVDNSGLLANSSTITGDVTNNATGALNSMVKIAGDVTNKGTANLGGEITGLLDNSTNKLALDGNLTVGSLKNSGTITVDMGETLTSKGTSGGTGTITVNGKLVSEGAYTNSGTLTVNNELEVDDGLWNNKTLNLNNANVTGEVRNQQGATTNISGTSTIIGNLNNQGTITGTAVDAQLFVKDGTFHNNGTINVSGNSTLTIEADIISFGKKSKVSTSGVTLNGFVANYGSLTLDGTSPLNGGLLNAASGDVTVTAAQNAANNSITNRGDFLVQANGSLSNVNTLENAGTFTINTNGAVTAASAKNSAGTMTIGGTLTAPLINSGGARVWLVNGGTLNGTLSNSGILTGTGNVTGQITNGGQILVENGNTLTAGIPIDNRGYVRVTGTLDGALINKVNSTTKLDGGTINKTVNNAGIMTGNGTIKGKLDNTGRAYIGGQMAGVTNSGRLVTDGVLNVDSLVNTGTVRVDAGEELASTTAIDNQKGLIQVDGKLRAGLVNGADADVLLNGGTITGSVTNNGWLGGRGTISNSVLNGGTLVTNGQMTITNLTNTGKTNVKAGTTLASANVIDNQGTLDLAGTLDADLTSNADATTALTGNSVITGNVRNNGTLLGNGTIEGFLTNSGLTNVGAGQTLSAKKTFNTDRLAISGTLKSDVQNKAGATTEMRGGTIDGAVSNIGTLSGAGSVTGTLTNTATLTAIGRLELGKLVNQTTLNISKGNTIASTAMAANSGNISLGGTLDGGLSNNLAGTLQLQGGEMTGLLINNGVVRGTGKLTGGLTNNGNANIGGAAGKVTNNKNLNILGKLTVAGLNNTGTGVIAVEATDHLVTQTAATNSGLMTIAGTLDGNINNTKTVRLTGGTINGRLTNSNNANLTGKVTEIVNAGTVTTNGALEVGKLTNNKTLNVNAGATLTSANKVQNTGTINLAGNLQADVANATTGTIDLDRGTVTGDVDNSGTVEGNGTIDGSLTTRAGSATTMSGTITKDLINQGATLKLSKDLTIKGVITGGTAPQTNRAVAAAAAPAGATPAAVAGPSMTINAGTTLTALGGVTNYAGSALSVDGTLDTTTVTNYGSYAQTGTLDGSLDAKGGSATLGGTVTGNVNYTGGTLVTNNGLSIGGKLTLGKNHKITAGTQISAANTLISDGAILALDGTLRGAVTNEGTLEANGTTGKIAGNLNNSGTIDMQNGNPNGKLTLGGLSGNGTVLMDVKTGDTLAADHIVVDGGRTTGNLTLTFASPDKETGSLVGKRVMLLDVDDSFGTQNDFTYSATPLSNASERIVYSVDQNGDDGDLTLVSQVNPAIGAMFANVTLVQSLIGSVINRPTSPYVTGLVVDSTEKPCGVGGWGRATGGTADVEGKTDNQVSVLNNKVSANYYGMQGGIDLACFDDRFGGWDMAFGALGGVNIGDSRQPIFAINGYDSQATTGSLSSITTTDFQQRYVGVYATASKDRWVADLQFRLENTDFELKNKPVVGDGLGITDPDFSSDGYTLSGSVSYSMPIAKTGWNLTPTVGFAWSKYSTESISFDDGFWMEFDDSDRQIGFVGATVSKAFVRMEENAAIQTFATATYYKDFADAAVSRLYNDELEGYDTQVMTSDNLKSYTELSVGANYVKVLNPGQAGGARQFSTSARIDGRFGSNIDSVGVTGQIRWQF